MANEKKTVSKSPVAMSVAKYDKAYEKNYDKLLKENITKIRKATSEGKGKGKGVEIMERLAEKARRETNKELGFTFAQASRRDQEKKKASPRVKAEAAVRRYSKGSYKK